ncbi:SlyX family protein [Methylopila turkensis]|uniref:Protein SlyX n=1 Tax=Methylopila turkensis TaxID=1437816 RepID=A0A9W6N6L9_9HYPH|nr:SlyX family protein [Methylopila turkensis]GLK79451.1 protein SlyX [Methylopila turkensis]
MADDAQRIDALEERIAYQDEAIETLNQTVTAQWAVIDALKREVAALGERLEDAVSGPAPVDRPPPHY